MDITNQLFAIFKKGDKNDNKKDNNKHKFSGGTDREALRSIKLGKLSSPIGRPTTDYDQLCEATSILVQELDAHLEKYEKIVALAAIMKDFYAVLDMDLSSLKDAKNAITGILNEMK